MSRLSVAFPSRLTPGQPAHFEISGSFKNKCFLNFWTLKAALGMELDPQVAIVEEGINETWSETKHK